MSDTYTLTEREWKLLTDAVEEYILVMGEAEGTSKYTQYMLDTGLGSALKKLYKGRKGGKAYRENYKSHREGYSYPTYEEWLSCQNK